MNKIYTLTSDWEITDEICRWIMNRYLEQKVLYLNEWADLYYQDKAKDEIYVDSWFSTQELIEFWIEKTLTNNWINSFISLWCWNSIIEKKLFEKIWNTYKIHYYGVDSSKNMLELSIKNLSDIKNIQKEFICADFSTDIFKRELTHMTSNSDKRIFVFFSNTFWNINQTNIIDILYNLLNKWETIRLDVRLREWTSSKDDLIAFNHYYRYLETKKDIFFSPLKTLSIPFENWKLIMSTKKEQSLGALKYEFSFLFTKKTKIKVKSDEITILPKEKIKLQQIYTYDSEWLINFFKEHWFKLVDKFPKKLRWHFLFKKI